MIVAEIARVRAEISKVGKVEIVMQKVLFRFTFEIVLSMIDGKVLLAANGILSSNSCSICNASGSEPTIQVNRSANATRLAMSPLHARIKFMENLLKIAYNLSFEQVTVQKVERVAARVTAKRKDQELFSQNPRPTHR